MAQRAMSVTGCEDEYLASQMVQVITDMANYCQTHGVSDGNVGMRSLIDWITSYNCTGNPYESALESIPSLKLHTTAINLRLGNKFVLTLLSEKSSSTH